MTTMSEGKVRGLVERAIDQAKEYAINFYADGGGDWVVNVANLGDARKAADALDAECTMFAKAVAGSRAADMQIDRDRIIVLGEWTDATPAEPGLYRLRDGGEDTDPMWVMIRNDGRWLRGYAFGDSESFLIRILPGRQWQLVTKGGEQ